MTNAPGISFYNQDRFSDPDFVANFVARNDQMEALLNGLRHIASGGETEHQILIGARGMGKTSLLRRIAIGVMNDPELAAAFIPLRFREEQYNIISLDTFWRNCGESLAEYCEQSGNQSLADRLDIAIDTREWRDPDIAREGFLAACREAGGRAILLLDNLDLILEGIKVEGCWSLRAALQKEDGPIVIGAATQLLEQGADREKPFYEFFHPHILEPLTEPELFACLTALARQRGEAGAAVAAMLGREPERVRALYVLTGGNPRVLALVYQLLEQTDSETIFADLEALLDQVTPFYKARIEEYQTPLQRAVIDGIALNWDPITSGVLSQQAGIEPTTLSAQLIRLKKDGLIEEVETSGTRVGYQLAERFLNIWYLMRHGTRKTKARLRWFTMFLTKLFSADELQRMAGDARNGAGRRWHPDHCEAVVEAYEMRLRSEMAFTETSAGELMERAFTLSWGGRAADVVASCEDVIMSLGSSETPESLPRLVAALMGKGIALGALERPEEEIAIYDEVFARFSEIREENIQTLVATALLFKGGALGLLGRQEDAISTYGEILLLYGAKKTSVLDPQVALALVGKGSALEQLGRLTDAIAVYDDVETRFGGDQDVNLQAQLAMALCHKGNALSGLGRHAEATEAFDTVMGRFGASPNPIIQIEAVTALSRKGAMLHDLGHLEEAIAVFDQLTGLFGQSDVTEVRRHVAMSIGQKGVTLGKLARQEEAITAFEKIIEYFGADEASDFRRLVALAEISVSMAYRELGRFDDAITMSDKVIARIDTNEKRDLLEQLAMALITKGGALDSLGRSEDAIAVYDEIVARFGSVGALDLIGPVARALLSKGEALEKLGRTEEALTAYRASAQFLNANEPISERELLISAQVRIGKILFWKSDLEDEGMFELASALESDPNSIFALANIFWMQIATSENREAISFSRFEALSGVGKILMYAGLALASDNLGESLTHLGEALDTGFSPSEDGFDYFEDLLWYLRIAAKRGHGERLIAWFVESGNADRYAPVYGAFIAHVRGERQLLDLNPEVRGVARPLFETLSGHGPDRKPRGTSKAGKQRSKPKPR